MIQHFSFYNHDPHDSPFFTINSLTNHGEPLPVVLPEPRPKRATASEALLRHSASVTRSEKVGDAASSDSKVTWNGRNGGRLVGEW